MEEYGWKKLSKNAYRWHVKHHLRRLMDHRLLDCFMCMYLIRLTDGCITRLIDRCITRLTDGCITRLIDRCIARLTDGCITRLIDRCIARLTDGCITRLIYRCIARLTDGCMTRLVDRCITRLTDGCITRLIDRCSRVKFESVNIAYIGKSCKCVNGSHQSVYRTIEMRNNVLCTQQTRTRDSVLNNLFWTPHPRSVPEGTCDNWLRRPGKNRSRHWS